jgi:hypothetical protein
MAVVAVVVAWVALSALVGLFAHNRGREPVLAVIAALVLSPVFGFLLVAALKDKVAERRHAELLAAIRGDTGQAVETPVPRADKAIVPAPADRSETWVVLVILLMLAAVAVIAGLSQLGSSANTTFNTLTDAM